METNVNKPIYDDKTKNPLVEFIEDFTKPVLEAENKKNPRKIEDEIVML